VPICCWSGCCRYCHHLNVFTKIIRPEGKPTY